MTNNAMNTYIARPAAGRGPGVLALHAWWGLNGFFKTFCDRLAAEGFIVVAPDLYRGRVASTVEEAQSFIEQIDYTQAAADVLEALSLLQQITGLEGNEVGVVGFSMGANWALWLSIEMPEAIKAVTVFYGVRDDDYNPALASYLGHFAENDPFEPLAGVQKMEKDLTALNRPVKFHIYPGTGHWFFEEDRLDAYNAEAATLAWGRTLAFLKAELAR